MKKNILKIINVSMYILAIILILLIWTVGINNVSLQPFLINLGRIYVFIALITVGINLRNHLKKN